MTDFTPPPPEKARTPWKPTKVDVLMLLLAANIIGSVGLGIRVYRGSKPTVVTVGVTQLTREYVSRLATSQITPQEANIRTQMFMSIAQEAVKKAATEKGVIVMARECVLAGEFADVTPDVARAVNATMDRATASRLATPALPVIPATPLPPGGFSAQP
ncbi:MAG: hypothetical protein B7Z26_08440 [Asticcacaulis sp. 32-58-5]|nr:MAG: hypothetical protein B7Z26_08440 [Asticcacaulis sp. 32-58-5]